MLSNIQELIARTIYENIRVVCVTEGYTPNIADQLRYPTLHGKFTQVAETNWNTDLNAIKNTKGFAIELYGESSSYNKEEKKTPRISIVSRRIMPGTIGSPNIQGYVKDPDNPNQLRSLISDWNSVNLHWDIILTSASSAEDRILNAIIGKALGVRRYIKIPFTTDMVFIEQFNYYDIPLYQKGIIDKVFSYEVSDIFLYQELSEQVVPLLKEIQIGFSINGETPNDTTTIKNNGVII